jgi:hypothetical protein
MTTYNFIGKASSQSVNWNDPSVWAGGVFPNSSTADVVFPKITTSDGNIYTSFVTISNAQSYSANTVSITDNYLLLGGILSVTSAVNVMTGGEIDVTGGTLSADRCRWLLTATTFRVSARLMLLGPSPTRG